MTDEPKPQDDSTGDFLIYDAPDGNTRIEIRMQDETVWLTQKQMAELFQTSKQNISLHLQNVFDEGELAPDSTVKKYLTVQTEGKRAVSRQIDHYNLQAALPEPVDQHFDDALDELKRIEGEAKRRKEEGDD